MLSKTLALLTAILVVTMAGSVAHAAVITYVGAQLDFEAKTADGGTGWRNTTPAKTYDIDGDNVLGTDGYNMFGTAKTANATYVSSVDRITGVGNARYENAGNTGEYMDDPDNTSVDFQHGAWYNNSAVLSPLFTFTLTNTGGALDDISTIRVTVFQDWAAVFWGSTGSQQYTLAGPGGATASSGFVTAGTGTGNAKDAVSFDITGFSDGDIYTVSAQTSGTYYSHATDTPKCVAQ